MATQTNASLPEGFTPDPQQQAEERAREEQRAAILKQILTPEALERLGRVKIVKRDKAEALETRLLELAMRGELQQQITEGDLIQMLEQSSATAKAGSRKITIKRRGFLDDDDEDDNDDDLM